MKIHNTGTRESWVEFLTAKGFRLTFQDEWVCVFKGCNPLIRVILSDTVHKWSEMEYTGTICADFECLYNKPSSCSIYLSDNVSHKEFWNAIELLMDAGIEWSQNWGRIERGNGYLYCNPPINSNKHGRKDKR